MRGKRDPLRSLPTRERGLKRAGLMAVDSLVSVAPYAGAWIETRKLSPSQRKGWVAPYAGAWIETAPQLFCLQTLDGRSLRGSVD